MMKKLLLLLIVMASCITSMAKVDWSEWDTTEAGNSYSDCPPYFKYGKYSYMPIPGSENEVCLIDGYLYSKIFSGGATPDLLDTTFDGEVDIPETVNYQGVEYTVTQIDSSVGFINATELKLPSSIKSVGSGKTPKLTELILPEGLQEIEANSFFNNKLIKELSLPSSLRVIAGNCFTDNEVNKISFSDGLMEVGANSFSDNPNLTEALLPMSLLRIGEGSFCNCGSLQTVQLPRWLISNVHLFNGCTQISKIISPSKNPPMVYESFDKVNKDVCVVVVPKGAAEKYRNSFFWEDFKNIIESELSDVENVELTLEPVKNSEIVRINGIKLSEVSSAEDGEIIIVGDKKVRVVK